VTGKFLTVSAGVVTAQPPRGASHVMLLGATRVAMGEATASGGNRAIRGEI
jgi:PleD family two-component response regulator